MGAKCCKGTPDVDANDTAGLLEVGDAVATIFGEKEAAPKKRGCCQSACCKVCGIVTLVVVVLLAWVVLRVATAECAVASFDHHYILPANAKDAGVPEPFDLGTEDNMDLKDIGVDLTGVWWMDGNPLTAEHLVSFASAKGKKPFPSLVPLYNNKKGRWTWTDNIYGRGLMAYYAFDASSSSTMDFNFTSSSNATILPVGSYFDDKEDFLFNKLSADEWSRPNPSPYVLRRIVNGDGSKGQFWDKFLKWYDSVAEHGKMMVYSSDSDCLRRCQYFLPCGACNAIC